MHGTEPRFESVFRSGDGGYASIRIPSLVVTRTGTILAFAEGRSAPEDQAGNDIILRRSRDGGHSWGPLQRIQEDGLHSLNNPTAVVDHPSGRILLVYQRIPSHLKETSTRTETGYQGTNVYRNLLTWSDDDGNAWTAPSDITRSTKRETGATTIASGPGIGIQLTRGKWSGRILIPMNEGPYHQWNNYAIYSDDHGATWTMGANVPGAFLETSPGVRRSQINEVQMVELTNGSVRMNSRPFAGMPVRKTAVSHDGGETWSQVGDVPELPDPSCNAGLLRLSFPSAGAPGVLLFSGPRGSRRAQGTVALSHDDGATWPVRRTLWPGFFGYSALAALPDGDVGCLFEVDEYQRILFAWFSPAWLAAGQP